MGVGSFLRFLFTLFLVIVAFAVIKAVLSILFKVVLILIILGVTLYLYKKGIKKKSWRYFK